MARPLPELNEARPRATKSRRRPLQLRKTLLAVSLAAPQRIAKLSAGIPGKLLVGGLTLLRRNLVVLQRCIAAVGPPLEILLRPVALPQRAVEESRGHRLAKLTASLWISVIAARVVIGVAASAAGAKRQRGGDEYLSHAIAPS